MTYSTRRTTLRATTARTPFRFTGSPYQLFSGRELKTGDYVEINGPHDTFGVVTRSDAQADGRYLNQVRGFKPRIGETPVASL